MSKPYFPDVLALRYASPPIVGLWCPVERVIAERRLWVAALKAQKSLGMKIPLKAIRAYEACIDTVDLERIRELEKKLRHDVLARIHAFNELAGYELIHTGFTSRDITENVEQFLIFYSLHHVRDRTIPILARLGVRMLEYNSVEMCGRSHFVPGQPTTLGKRFATIAEELLLAYDALGNLMRHYPLRGIKGPMGTQQDMLEHLGHIDRAGRFENAIRRHLGFPRVLTSTGQVYPRSLDFAVVSVLVQLGSALGNLAKMIRLNAGLELMHEGFGKEQSGSSAMPHKMNSRTCERINSLLHVLCGYCDMISRLLGDQWLEGDVSCSVVRRVVFPDVFFALDGMYEAAMTVLDEMQIFPARIKRELGHYLPFLSTTRLIIEGQRRGLGRETAHALIKEHALSAIAQLREGSEENSFVRRLGGDERFPLSQGEIELLLRKPIAHLGSTHVHKMYGRIRKIITRFPHEAAYQPEAIL